MEGPGAAPRPDVENPVASERPNSPIPSAKFFTSEKLDKFASVIRKTASIATAEELKAEICLSKPYATIWKLTVTENHSLENYFCLCNKAASVPATKEKAALSLGGASNLGLILVKERIGAISFVNKDVRLNLVVSRQERQESATDALISISTEYESSTDSLSLDAKKPLSLPQSGIKVDFDWTKPNDVTLTLAGGETVSLKLLDVPAE